MAQVNMSQQTNREKRVKHGPPLRRFEQRIEERAEKRLAISGLALKKVIEDYNVRNVIVCHPLLIGKLFVNALQEYTKKWRNARLLVGKIAVFNKEGGQFV